MSSQLSYIRVDDLVYRVDFFVYSRGKLKKKIVDVESKSTMRSNIWHDDEIAE